MKLEEITLEREIEKSLAKKLCKPKAEWNDEKEKITEETKS